MEIGIDLNENNQVMVFSFDEENGIRVEIDENILEGIQKGYLYKYIEGNFIRDKNREQYIQNLIQIEELKQKLNETDYIVTKSMEYQITGKTIPSDYNQILAERDSWREQINTLENEIKA